ncbi:EthD family reductase [Rhodoblastus acidophilus]|uniref:EthD family reductase n=1 Tax=Candidatus Rhodoblastus alkanivorans TaxID=2954117 RepID=A0ABS9Z6R8_9HYPH|nr:EthD family reductase [Candidatus Rhodoblastus alkanivorans]MCI4680727.1 EthD family reductase [Candidatus Rhodoblastus alkanivorans]MCI4683364.1 EthD family reductase [Candidatus Rhodoblastus alkanivorans]MDI4640676.1 EthD family reductase [Rhodoblastus acidophilus]
MTNDDDAEDEGGIKITVLYGQPKDPAAFEQYYAETHLPLVDEVDDLGPVELSMGLPGPDGSPPEFYRMAELWFENEDHLQSVTATAEWKRVVEDVPKFATGGAKVLVSKIE